MSISSAALIKVIQENRLRVFHTSDILSLAGMGHSAATQALRRMAAQGITARIKRGVWINRLADKLNTYEAVQFLREPWPAYVSLYSVLSDSGIVEEIPQVIYGVSSAPAKRYKTVIGEFHIHHLPPRLMWGFETRSIGSGSYLSAEPEKAFLDTVYLALIPSSRIRMPQKRGEKWDLDFGKVKIYALKFAYPPLIPFLKQNNLFK